jgi:glyoxylase-like metal-dependent hydrolase (beta-lactamase superfamily II)
MSSLRDGYVDMPPTRLRRPGNRVFGDDLPPQVRLVDGNLRLSVNAFAIDDGTHVTLIDTGASNAWHPTMGLLPQALREANIAVDRVRTVAFTHTHLDHIHGLVLPNGDNAFPQLSRLLVPKQEFDMFRVEARLQRFHERAEAFEGGQRIGANIEAIAAHGHEVGHTCFRVASADEAVLVWGDIVHVPSIQFDQPEITWEFDGDQEQARASRLRIMALAADNMYYIAGAHLDSPGVGRITHSGTGFRFDPL